MKKILLTLVIILASFSCYSQDDKFDTTIDSFYVHSDYQNQFSEYLGKGLSTIEFDVIDFNTISFELSLVSLYKEFKDEYCDTQTYSYPVTTMDTVVYFTYKELCDPSLDDFMKWLENK